jgi:hypothetical protein
MSYSPQFFKQFEGQIIRIEFSGGKIVEIGSKRIAVGEANENDPTALLSDFEIGGKRRALPKGFLFISTTPFGNEPLEWTAYRIQDVRHVTIGDPDAADREAASAAAFKEAVSRNAVNFEPRGKHER